LDDEQRAVLQREVVAEWEAFEEDDVLLLRQPVTFATARK
jgi:hypothetical protein